jgi:hypothetical protein
MEAKVAAMQPLPKKLLAQHKDRQAFQQEAFKAQRLA